MREADNGLGKYHKNEEGSSRWSVQAAELLPSEHGCVDVQENPGKCVHGDGDVLAFFGARPEFSIAVIGKDDGEVCQRKDGDQDERCLGTDDLRIGSQAFCGFWKVIYIREESKCQSGWEVKGMQGIPQLVWFQCSLNGRFRSVFEYLTIAEIGRAHV